jgi:secreted trypsin-like serine protease
MRPLLLLVLVLALPPLAGAEASPWRLLEAPLPGGTPPAVVPNIYNGVATFDFPAVVVLVITSRDGSRATCSGTLIAPTAVLTAAHCLSFEAVRVVAVVFLDAETRVEYVASAFTIHPRFSLPRVPVADLAIVRLAQPVANVEPLALVSRSPRPRTAGLIVGFGDDGSHSFEKRFGTVQLRRCPRGLRVQGSPVRLGKALCWRPNLVSADTCVGDSGGPLLVDGAVAGVTSGGVGTTACPGQLSFDTNVARYRGWIAAMIEQ